MILGGGGVEKFSLVIFAEDVMVVLQKRLRRDWGREGVGVSGQPKKHNSGAHHQFLVRRQVLIP